MPRLLALFAFCLTPIAYAQMPAINPEAPAIFAMMNKSAEDWNRGDIDAFVTGYKNSPDIIFIGQKISHGYAEMVANYRKHYSTRAKMGTLRFTDLDVQPLDERFATATGKYHLDLAPEEGSRADGYFMLVLEKTAEGWKIVRDDTTTLTK